MLFESSIFYDGVNLLGLYYIYLLLLSIMENYKSADRLSGFDQPRVWSVLTPLAQ
jgi:hypothetical protein